MVRDSSYQIAPLSSGALDANLADRVATHTTQTDEWLTTPLMLR
jgi:hypothetical protein